MTTRVGETCYRTALPTGFTPRGVCSVNASAAGLVAMLTRTGKAYAMAALDGGSVHAVPAEPDCDAVSTVFSPSGLSFEVLYKHRGADDGPRTVEPFSKHVRLSGQPRVQTLSLRPPGVPPHLTHLCTRANDCSGTIFAIYQDDNEAGVAWVYSRYVSEGLAGSHPWHGPIITMTPATLRVDTVYTRLFNHQIVEICYTGSNRDDWVVTNLDTGVQGGELPSEALAEVSGRSTIERMHEAYRIYSSKRYTGPRGIFSAAHRGVAVIYASKKAIMMRFITERV